MSIDLLVDLVVGGVISWGHIGFCASGQHARVDA